MLYLKVSKQKKIKIKFKFEKDNKETIIKYKNKILTASYAIA